MTRRAAQLVCGALLLFAIAPALSPAQRVRPLGRQRPRVFNTQRPLPEILQRVVRSAASIRLYGERVVDQRVQGQLVRHSEIVFRMGNRLRITFPPDSRFSGQVIVDDGNTRRRYTPRNDQVTEQPSQHDDVLSRLVGAKNQLLTPKVSLRDGGLVAGVQTTLANILDKNNQVVQALYIDPNTGAVLKRVGFDKTGAEVAFYEFTSVRYNQPIDSGAFNLPRTNKPTVTPERTLKNVAARGDLPALMLKPGQGFRLVNSRLQPRANVQVLHEVYLGSNGRLSVFVLRAPIDPSRLSDRAGKQINAYSTQAGGATVVLVGPYPLDTLKRLAGNLVSP